MIDTLRGNFPKKPQPTERASEVVDAQEDSLQRLERKGPTYSLADDALHGAGERRRHAEAAVVQDVHCHLEAATQLAQ